MKYRFHSMQAAAILIACLFVGQNAYAAETDIANAPLSSSSTDVVKPNIMFILDDSGSMDNSYSPDDAGNFTGAYGAKSVHCNGMYFNPPLHTSRQ